MDFLQGIWRIDEARAWDANRNKLPPPYGANPIGQIPFSKDRMLASLCNGDTQGCEQTRLHVSWWYLPVRWKSIELFGGHCL